MRTKKLFSMKKVMRTMALGLATMLVVGSVNVMEVEAEDVFSPGYDETTGKYVYNELDVFGAATHVHLFGEEVTTTVHTHGNVMALKADLGEIGMRDGKVAYPSDYIEYSYAGDWVNLSTVTVHNPLIIGDDMSYDSATKIITSSPDAPHNSYTTSASTVRGGVYSHPTDGDAVDITGTLATLQTKSNEWRQQPQSTWVEYELTDSQYMNNCYINANQVEYNDDGSVAAYHTDVNTYVNITYDEWKTFSTHLTLQGLDNNVTNHGFVIINIDMANAPKDQVVDMSRGDMKAYDIDGNGYNNTEHSTAAFGGCRVVYNFYDSSNDTQNYAYTGSFKLSGTLFGNILAPKATVEVGAINGNVMAKKIVHSGQESHRLDIVPVFSVRGTTDVPTTVIEKEEIKLLLVLEDQSVVPTETGVSSDTTYQLYTDADCTILAPVSEVTATWNKDIQKYELIISSAVVTDKLDFNTPYYLKKTDVNDEYADNYTVFEAYVTNSGSVMYREMTPSSTVNDRTSLLLTDVLQKQTVVPNEKIEINVEFSGPTGTTAPNPSGVKYEIYEDPATTVKVPNSTTEAADGKVVFGTGITGSLDKNVDYYIKVTGNDSGYKDDSADVYQVQFGDDGKPKYYNSTTGQYETTPPTDKLIKNEGIQLNVTLEGDTSTGTDSNVKYNVYDSNGNPVLDSSVSATKGSSDTTYKVVVDTAVTTDKLNRQPAEYYIAIDTNSSGYDDKVPDEKFWVKFDENGNAQYSKDKQTWSGDLLEDVLVKAKDTSSETTPDNPSSEPNSEPSSQPTNPPAGDSGNSGNNTGSGNTTGGNTNDGGSASGSGSTGTADPGNNNGGASNAAGNNTNKGTADGANANNSATDGANANNSAVTGSNSMNSAKTGEVQTVYIFAGFAALIAIAAGVYVFIKRKRA